MSPWMPRGGALPWLAGLILAALLGASPAMADDRADARRHFQAGMDRIAAGEYDLGIQELQLAYQILPHPWVYYNIGKAYLDSGRPALAIPYLEAYVAAVPGEQEDAARLLEVARQQVAGASATSAAEEASGSPDLDALRGDLSRILTELDSLLEESRAAQGPSAEAALGRGDDLAGGDDPYAQVVVTSAGYSQSPLEAPNTLTVITAEDIRQAGARTLPDVLRRVPGLEVMAITPGDYNLGVRGFNSTLAGKVLVLVDGRSVYMDFIGATLWPLLSISVSDIQRIEVIRGPGAALYGANAFSGVVNIITKRPGASGDDSQLTLRGGIPDWSDGAVHLSGRGKILSYRASLGFERVERWAVEVDGARDDYQVLAEEPELATDVVRADMRLERRFSRELLVGLSGGVATGQVEFTAIGALRDYRLDGTHSYLRGDLILPGGTSVRAFWNHLDAQASPWAVPTGGLTLEANPQSEVVDVEVKHSRRFELGVPHLLQVGAGYRFKTIDWEYLPVVPRENHASLYIQDELRLAEPLIAVASLRMDRHPVLVKRSGEDIGFFDRVPTSPRLALVWRVDETQSLRINVGTAFRNPTFLESYLDIPVPTSNHSVVVRSLGNPELGPERILSTEIGYLNSPPTERYELQAAAYFNQVTDLIALGPVGPLPAGQESFDPQGGYWYAGATSHVNEAEAFDALGGEVGIRLFPSGSMDLWANYAYAHLWSGPLLAAELVESTSAHKLNAGIQHRAEGGMEVGVDFHFVDEQVWRLRSFDESGGVISTPARLPAYALLNVRLGYRSPVDRLELSVEGTNLLALIKPATTTVGGATPTDDGHHREHPLGQPIPVGVSARGTVRF